MKKLTLLLLLLNTFAFSQENNTSTEVVLGPNARDLFIKNGETFKLREYKQVFENPLAQKKIRKARANKSFGTIISVIGGFGIGYGAGMFVGNLSNGNPDNPWDKINAKSNREVGLIYMAMGLGVTATSIPLWIGYKKNIDKALDLENDTATYSNTLNFNINENGFGLAYKF